jgi:hypothetical protein
MRKNKTNSNAVGGNNKVTSEINKIEMNRTIQRIGSSNITILTSTSKNPWSSLLMFILSLQQN